MCNFGECGCGAITSARGATGATGATGSIGPTGVTGASGAGTLRNASNSGGSALTTDIYNGGSGAVVGTVTISGVTNASNEADISFTASVAGTAAYSVLATINYNGAPSTAPYNITRMTLATEIAGATYGEVTIRGTLSNVGNGDVITVKLLASSGAVTAQVTSWYSNVQIFE